MTEAVQECKVCKNIYPYDYFPEKSVWVDEDEESICNSCLWEIAKERKGNE